MWQAQSDSGYKKSRREIGQDWRRTGEPHTNDENGGEGKSWHQNIADCRSHSRSKKIPYILRGLEED